MYFGIAVDAEKGGRLFGRKKTFINFAVTKAVY